MYIVEIICNRDEEEFENFSDAIAYALRDPITDDQPAVIWNKNVEEPLAVIFQGIIFFPNYDAA